MKASGSKLIILTLITALFVAGAHYYISLKDRAYSPPKDEAAASTPGGDDIGVKPDDVYNSYPLPSVDTVFGHVQRLGSSGADSVKAVYFIGEFMYLIFSSAGSGYDSRRSGSVNIAKLGADGTIISVTPLTAGDLNPRAEYSSSKPVWNGIAICLSDGSNKINKLLYVDFNLNITKEASEAFAENTEMYFLFDKLYLYSSSHESGILSVKIFDSALLPTVSKSVSLPSPCEIYGIYGGVSSYVVLNAEDKFYVYCLSGTAFEKTAEENGVIASVTPAKDGYITVKKNSAVLCLYDAKFKKTEEKAFDDPITGIEKTQFGYIVTSQKNDSSKVYFLCPHLDVLLSETRGESLRPVNINGSVYLLSFGGEYLNIYILSDFVINAHLTVAAAVTDGIKSLSDKNTLYFVFTSEKVSSLASYGSTDVFVAAVKV
ncbi:MAG: hypothetical protein LBT30_06935 [Clostridiales bacterium]|jgi:hypothetical protein|nr:hypothetical protein [Clostridiales bacterium]